MPKVKKNRRKSADITKKTDETILSDIVNKTWHIYSVSTMFNCILYDELSLKMYGKRIRELLAQFLPKEDFSYTATLEVLHDKITASKTGPPPMKIQVRAKNATKEVIVYIGIMLSWGTTKIPKVLKNCVTLPLLLCRGTASTIKTMEHILAQIFDCTIVDMSVNAYDLKLLLTMALMTEETDSEGEVKIVYKIIDSPKAEDIIISYKVPQATELIKRIIDDQSEVTAEIVENFVNILQYHFRIYGHIHLDRCLLYKIILPFLVIDNNRFKVSSMELLNIVLNHFHNKTLDELYQLEIGPDDRMYD